MRFAARSIGLCLQLALAGATVAATSVPAVAHAQTAADKATARQLALEGIDLYKAGKHADALDRLQRAQELYDAPIHLIYIARCQAKLGQLVEAAESYRRLVRTKLAANAPKAFKDAVADAEKELPDVEPKIAGLRIDVEPKGIKDLSLKIDETNVSSAVVGVQRPSNPGSRTITASAPGYKTATATIDLGPGEKKNVTLAMEVDPDAAAAGTGTKPGGDGAGSGDAPPPGGEPEGPPPGLFGFIVGLRVGGLLPVGNLQKDEPMKDYYGSGGGAELRAGVRVAQHYSVLLLAGGGTYTPGSTFDEGPPGSTIKTTPVGQDAGVGFMYAAKPGKLGPFGELSFMFIHRLDAQRDVALAPPAACPQTLSASGTAFRLGGGVQIPLSDWFQLSPYATLSIGRVAEFNVDSDCNDPQPAVQDTPWEDPGSADPELATSHVIIGLGVGGDLIFGGDKPRK